MAHVDASPPVSPAPDVVAVAPPPHPGKLAHARVERARWKERVVAARAESDRPLQTLRENAARHRPAPSSPRPEWVGGATREYEDEEAPRTRAAVTCHDSVTGQRLFVARRVHRRETPHASTATTTRTDDDAIDDDADDASTQPVLFAGGGDVATALASRLLDGGFPLVLAAA